jgi:hypothetical protein
VEGCALRIGRLEGEGCRKSRRQDQKPIL